MNLKVLASIARPQPSALRLSVQVAWLLGLALYAGEFSLAASTLASSQPTEVEIYYSGLYNPKDLEWDEQGNLLVAESGKPGEVMIPLPAQYGSTGPIGYGGQVSRITPRREHSVVARGLPNLGIYSGSEILGPSGLARLNGKTYLVQAAHLTESCWLLELTPGVGPGYKRLIDIGSFNKKYLAEQENGDAVPTGNPYDLIAWRGGLYISDGNFNRILKVDLKTLTLSIFAKSPRQTTTTGMAIGPDDALYVTQFGNAPYYAGSGRVDRVTADGKWESGYVKGLQNPLGVAFDSHGSLYVLQFAALFSPAQLKYLPYGGKILKVQPDGSLKPVVVNLTYPTFLKIDSQDQLWVSNYGNQSSKGEGQILKIRLGNTLGQGPKITIPIDTPTVEVLKAEALARDQLAKMNALQAEANGIVVKIMEGVDTLTWGYEPSELSVPVGSRVTFLNTGKMPHTATDTQGVFDTGFIAAGATKTIEVKAAGTHNYICTPHPWMKGKLIATAQKASPGVGSSALPPSPSSMDQVSADAPNASQAKLTQRLVNPWAVAGLVITLIALTLGVASLLRKDPRR